MYITCMYWYISLESFVIDTCTFSCEINFVVQITEKNYFYLTHHSHCVHRTSLVKTAAYDDTYHVIKLWASAIGETLDCVREP